MNHLTAYLTAYIRMEEKRNILFLLWNQGVKKYILTAYLTAKKEWPFYSLIYARCKTAKIQLILKLYEMRFFRCNCV